MGMTHPELILDMMRLIQLQALENMEKIVMDREHSLQRLQGACTAE